MSTYSKCVLEYRSEILGSVTSVKNHETIEYKTYKQQESTSNNKNSNIDIIQFDSSEDDEDDEKKKKCEIGNIPFDSSNDEIVKLNLYFVLNSNKGVITFDSSEDDEKENDKIANETNKFIKATTSIGRNKFQKNEIIVVSEKISDLIKEIFKESDKKKETYIALQCLKINDKLRQYKKSQTHLNKSSKFNLNEKLKGINQIYEKLLLFRKKRKIEKIF